MKISAWAVEKLETPINEFGLRVPIILKDCVIIAGHTRLLAALCPDMKGVPVHVATGLSPGQVKTLRLTDNRVGQEAEWDEELLKLELGALSKMGFDLTATGFDADEWALLGDTVSGEEVFVEQQNGPSDGTS